MLRSKIQHLLDFRATDAPVLEVDGPPESMAGWMKGLGSSPSDTNTNADKKDGPPPAKPEGNPPAVGDNKAGTSAPDPGVKTAPDQAAKQAAEAAEAAAKAEQDRKIDEAAKEARKQAELEKAKAAPAEEKWPRTSADWDKFKENRKQEREKLEREIKARDETIGTLQAKVEEAEKKDASNGDLPETVKNEMERLKKQADTYSQRLQELEVTAHPDFISYFKFKIDEQVAIAKDVLGEEKGKKFEEIINIPEHPSLKEYKKAAMDDLLGDLSPYESGSISYVTTRLREIERERQSEIAKAKTHSEQLKAKAAEQQKGVATQTAAQREKMFNDALASLKDDKIGMAVYQKRDGDDAWNKTVEQRALNAKRYLFGAPDLKAEEISRAALHAAAFPAILEAYKQDMAEWKDKADKLEGQVKALTAAQPGARNGGGGAGGGDDAIPGGKSTLKEDMNPFEASRAFANGMMAAQRGD